MPSVRKETTFLFFLFPALSVTGNAVLAAILSNTNLHYRGDAANEWRDIGSALSGMLSNASLSIVTLTFSLTVLSLQIASQTYSPRLLDDVLKAPTSQMALSVNLGAYAYSFCFQYWLFDAREGSGNDSVPILAIHMLSIHMVLVILMFLVFIHFFINGFRVESILFRAAESSWEAAKRLEKINNQQRQGIFDQDNHNNTSTRTTHRQQHQQDLPTVPPNCLQGFGGS